MLILITKSNLMKENKYLIQWKAGPQLSNICRPAALASRCCTRKDLVITGCHSNALHHRWAAHVQAPRNHPEEHGGSYVIGSDPNMKNSIPAVTLDLQGEYYFYLPLVGPVRFHFRIINFSLFNLFIQQKR